MIAIVLIVAATYLWVAVAALKYAVDGFPATRKYLKRWWLIALSIILLPAIVVVGVPVAIVWAYVSELRERLLLTRAVAIEHEHSTETGEWYLK